MSFVTRLDGRAALGAAAVTAAGVGLVRLVPDQHAQRVADMVRAFEDGEGWAMGVVVACALVLLAIGVAIECRRELWRALTFASSERTRADHTGCVVWLHGVGDSGEGFGWLRAQLRPALPHVKWALPTGGRITMTVADGAKLRGWLDVARFP
eukprot:3138778-Prymnesium_polylepis.1